MRKTLLAIAVGCIAVGLVAWSNAAPTPLSKKARTALSDSNAKLWTDSQNQAGQPIVESTGFEVPEWDAYTAGETNFFCGMAYWSTCTATPIPASCTGNPVADINCCIGFPNPLNGWFASGSSQHCREPHIEIAHPAAGAQHLRFTRDPLGGNPAGCVSHGTACRVNAFTPDMGPQAVGRNIQEFDLASSNTFGAGLVYFSVPSSGTSIGTYMYFYAGGYIYIYDYSDGVIVNAGNWFGDGNYYHVRIDKNPCAGTLDYYYNGALIYSTPLDEGPNFQRAIIQTNNGGDPTMFWDLDNYLITREGPCPTVCGNGVVEPGEACEPGVPGPCPDGRCVPAGQQGECTCTPICTLAEPCILRNGDNGPFVAPCDPAYACIFLYQGDTEAVEIDTCDGNTFDTRIFYWGSASDPGDPGTGNDDCCDPADPNCGANFGAGSTPNASCYGAPVMDGSFESCTCHDLPMPGDNLWLAQIGSSGGLPPGGGSFFVHINKKAACGQDILGSCCDTNGPDQGCVDNVPQSACTGPGKVFNNEKCADVTCACIPDCTGRECGSDGCGGSCGTCNDGNICTDDTCDDLAGRCVFTPNSDPCDDGNACTVNDTCAQGSCSGSPRNCDDGLFCNGVEGCDPQSGCTPGTAPNCSDGVACTVDSCNEATDSCDHAPSDALCDDGLFCNGAETCSPNGCVDGADPCDPDRQNCDEATDACINKFTPIPTVSQWGLAVIALMLLIGAKIFFSRRQAASF